MRGPGVIFVPMVLVMMAWLAYVGWLSRQAAAADVAAGLTPNTPAVQTDDAISLTEREMASDWR